MLEWAQHKDGNWCTPYVKTFCVVHHEGRGWTLNYDDWDGPELGSDFDTADEAKALAQRLQDVLDGRDAVSEAVERIVEECEPVISSLRQRHYECDDCWYSCPKSEDGCCNEGSGDECNCGADATNESLDALLALLRSRDWSKGEGE